MRAATEQKLGSTWYGDEPPPAWLKALVPLYRLGARFDRWRKERSTGTLPPGVYVIVVGNITVGGAGKTPLVIRLSQVLSEAGLRVGVVSRGYGRRTRDLRLVTADSSPDIVGDEPLLIARRAGVPVLVSPDRFQAAQKLAEKGIEVIIADDGLQHHRLPRQMEICVVDAARGFGNGLLLPAGPLREPVERLLHVDHVVLNGRNPSLELPVEAQLMTLVPGLLRSLESGQSWRLQQFSGCRVNAVAGIGNPERFFGLLRQARIQVVEHAFPDHHDFRASDFDGLEASLPILMTEKDAVKCQSLGLRNAWVLSVDAVLPQAFEQDVFQSIMAHRKASQ